MAKIEKLENQEAKQWAFDLLQKGDVLWAADRQNEGYPVVAEIPLADNEKALFNIPKALTILMHHKDKSKAIDDPEATYQLDEIVFDVETVD